MKAPTKAMARKKLTISEKAYRAVDRLTWKNESSTDITTERPREKGNLLEYVRSFPPDNELAGRLDKVLEKRVYIRIGVTRNR